jgi:hypothetical protein
MSSATSGYLPLYSHSNHLNGRSAVLSSDNYKSRSSVIGALEGSPEGPDNTKRRPTMDDDSDPDLGKLEW